MSADSVGPTPTSKLLESVDFFVSIIACKKSVLGLTSGRGRGGGGREVLGFTGRVTASGTRHSAIAFLQVEPAGTIHPFKMLMRHGAVRLAHDKLNRMPVPASSLWTAHKPTPGSPNQLPT